MQSSSAASMTVRFASLGFSSFFHFSLPLVFLFQLLFVELNVQHPPIHSLTHHFILISLLGLLTYLFTRTKYIHNFVIAMYKALAAKRRKTNKSSISTISRVRNSAALGGEQADRITTIPYNESTTPSTLFS